MRKFMPFISPRRNESLVYYEMDINVDEALRFARDANRGRERERRLTLFHLYLHACAKAIAERPLVNRFAAGGRLWQRNGVWLTFSAKHEIKDGSPLVTVKREFPEGETIDEMGDGVIEILSTRRSGKRDRSDKEMDFALIMPPLLVKIGLWALHFAGQHGMLSKKMIDDDPLYTSLFVANLGSVGLDAGYHHLWQYGTCSLFAVMGRVQRRDDGTRFIQVKYSYDERVEDGLYAAKAMDIIKQYVQNPKTLCPPAEEPVGMASEITDRG
jgi:hypothetical protein